MPGPEYLYWPNLDIDLTVESIRYPEKYPLISESVPNRVAGGFSPPTVSAYYTATQESFGMGGSHSSIPPSKT